MPEIFFFFSADDPPIMEEALRLGSLLVVEKHYKPDEDIVVISKVSSLDNSLFNRFYVIPDDRFLSEILTGNVLEKDGKSFRCIRDRIGSAAIDLILYRKPSEGEVCVGSLGFQSRTYPSLHEPLEPRPPVFAKAFRRLRSFIKRSAQPVPNKLFPKTVYVFPQAMALLREDFSRSPWPSLQITD